MVKIFDQKAGVVVTFFFLHGFRPVHVEQRKNQCPDKYYDQACKRKIFDQPERLDFFFCSLKVHKLRLMARYGNIGYRHGNIVIQIEKTIPMH